MKSFEDIQAQHKALQQELSRVKPQKEKRRLEAEWQKIKPLYLILMNRPSEKSLRKQLEDQKNKLKVIEERYKEWKPWGGSITGNLRAQYDKLMGVSEIKSKIKLLETILE